MRIASDTDQESVVIEQALTFANLGRNPKRRAFRLARYAAKLGLPPEAPRRMARYYALLVEGFADLLAGGVPDDDELVGDGPMGVAALFIEDGWLTVLEYEVPTVAALVTLATYFLSQGYWFGRLRQCPTCEKYFIRVRGRKATNCSPECKVKRDLDRVR